MLASRAWAQNDSLIVYPRYAVGLHFSSCLEFSVSPQDQISRSEVHGISFEIPEIAGIHPATRTAIAHGAPAPLAATRADHTAGVRRDRSDDRKSHAGAIANIEAVIFSHVGDRPGSAASARPRGRRRDDHRES